MWPSQNINWSRNCPQTLKIFVRIAQRGVYISKFRKVYSFGVPLPPALMMMKFGVEQSAVSTPRFTVIGEMCHFFGAKKNAKSTAE